MSETLSMESSALDALRAANVAGWDDIHARLDGLSRTRRPTAGALGCPAVAFVTFEYGVDGVSMEIAKYAASLEGLLGRDGRMPAIHCIGGDFSDEVDNVLASRWRRHAIPGTNGWSKWKGGRWFDALFLEDMPEGSERSDEVATEIWRQSLDIAGRLVRYLAEQDVGLMIPVNVSSNPGNPALALAVVIASELTGVVVLNSNHDFYWESGMPASGRAPGEEPGPRDHFFRNAGNRGFFRLLERIYPWDGARWIQLVINAAQGRALVERGFEERRVVELGTFIEDSYFAPVPASRKEELRLRLTHILGGGKRTIGVTAVDELRARASRWMRDQTPVVCGLEGGIRFELNALAIWLLQPTRVVPRKRIHRDWHLVGSLFRYPPFRGMFENNPERTLTLHVTGPVPAEHEADFVAVLDAYREVLAELPPGIARRVFLAFTVGKLGHSEFRSRGLANLTVADLYGLSDLVLLPSQTEGRGLPILEAAAAGVPLVCSRYEPRDVFEKVVGKGLKRKMRIRTVEFPEEEFEGSLLQEITDLLFLPELAGERKRRNRRAVASRFGMREMQNTFRDALERVTGPES